MKMAEILWFGVPIVPTLVLAERRPDERFNWTLTAPNVEEGNKDRPIAGRASSAELATMTACRRQIRCGELFWQRLRANPQDP